MRTVVPTLSLGACHYHDQDVVVAVLVLAAPTVVGMVLT